MLSSDHISVQDVLWSLQNAAATGSLEGPKAHLPTWATKPEEVEEWRRALHTTMSARPPAKPSTNKPLSAPLFLTVEDGPGTMFMLEIDGYKIHCFEKGGEKRLMMPDVLCALDGVSERDMYNAMKVLKINLPKCSRNQLDKLKEVGALPQTPNCCGLVTQSDYERLHGYVRTNGMEEKSDIVPNLKGFSVYHECFGECGGTLYPELYTKPLQPCIQCEECEHLFSPDKFVRHSHSNMENEVCHWGFDSRKWRTYLLLAEEQEDEEELTSQLAVFKDKFSMQSRKRTRSCTVQSSEKLSDPKVRKLVKSVSEDLMPCGISEDDVKRLQTAGPPKLLDPKKVVPFNEKDKYDKSYIPNVCLAPSDEGKKIVDDVDDDDDDEEVEEGHLVIHEPLSCSSKPTFSLPQRVSHTVAHRGEASAESRQDDYNTLDELGDAMSQVSDPSLREKLKELHAKAVVETKQRQQKAFITSRNLFLKEKELKLEQDSKAEALQNLSTRNKSLWEDLAEVKQTYHKETKELKDQVEALQSYNRDVFTKKDKEIKELQETCQRYREQLMQYEAQFLLARHPNFAAAFVNQAEASRESQQERHEHFKKLLLRTAAAASIVPASATTPN